MHMEGFKSFIYLKNTPSSIDNQKKSENSFRFEIQISPQNICVVLEVLWTKRG